MSGTTIPMMAQPLNPSASFQAALQPQLTEAQIGQAQAGIGQTQAQTGLIGQQAIAAGLGNQITAARIGAALPMIQGLGAASSGGGTGIGGTGPPGAAQAGGNGFNLPPPSTGEDGVILPGLPPLPRALAWGVENAMLTGGDVSKATTEALAARANLLSQRINSAMGPNGGTPDPQTWAATVRQAFDDGLIDSAMLARTINRPDLAPQISGALAPANEQPGFKAAQAGAQESAKAPYELVKVTVTNADGTTQEQMVPKSSLVGGASGQGANGLGPPVVDQSIPTEGQALLRALKPSESNGYGDRYVPPGSNRPSQVSDFSQHPGQGAAGAYQFEPATWQRASAAVGATDFSPASQDRAAWWQAQRDYGDATGRDLLHDLREGGHEQQIAGALKNEWPSIAGGSQQNAAGVSFPQRLATATSAAQQPPLPGGAVAAAGPVQLSPTAQRLADLDRGQITEDAATNAGNLQAGLNANKAGVQMRELRDLAASAPTGAWADQRMAFQSLATQFGGPLGQRLATMATGIDQPTLSQMEEINKLALNNVVSQEQAVGPGVRIGAMFTNFFAKASPNINMQAPAIHQILNMGLVAQQMAKDYANASNSYYTNARSATADSLAGGARYVRYQPLNQLEGQWTQPGSVHAPETYAAAANLINGVPPSKAFKGLTNDQQVEALRVVQRADPGSMDAVIALRGK